MHKYTVQVYVCDPSSLNDNFFDPCSRSPRPFTRCIAWLTCISTLPTSYFCRSDCACNTSNVLCPWVEAPASRRVLLLLFHALS